jgi:hypothetical protein
MAAGLRREKLIKVHLQNNILPSHSSVRGLRRKPSSQPFVDCFLDRPSDDISR